MSKIDKANEEKKGKEDKLWTQYNLHKKAAHDHFDAGQSAEKAGNWDLAYLKYNNAIGSRAQADGIWVQLKGGGMESLLMSVLCDFNMAQCSW